MSDTAVRTMTFVIDSAGGETWRCGTCGQTGGAPTRPSYNDEDARAHDAGCGRVLE